MYQVLIVCALISRAYGDAKIVGGEDANIADYNYHVSLQLNSKHLCGGSLVSSTVAVSAAHCVFGFSASHLSVKAGSCFAKEGGEWRPVKSIYKHRLYKIGRFDYDVAVLILVDAFAFSDKIGKVGLPPKNYVIEVGTMGSVTGWGAIEEDGERSNMLQVVRVPHVEWEDCRNKYADYRFSVRMSCWGYTEGGQDACQGDSGGPLISYNDDNERILVGIVSWGNGCARPNYPGVYTDLTNTEIYEFVAKYV